MNKINVKLNKWTISHYSHIAAFNSFLIIMFLLRSAGYFHPFFDITVNLIVVSALILSTFLLGVRSKIMFGIALFFWLFAGVIRLFQIDVWAERTALYTYEALVLGVLLLFWEIVTKRD